MLNGPTQRPTATQSGKVGHFGVSSLVGMRLSSNITGPSGISLDSAQKLFNWNLANSLTNNDGYAILPWTYALNGDLNNRSFLKGQFNLTDQ